MVGVKNELFIVLLKCKGRVDLKAILSIAYRRCDEDYTTIAVKKILNTLRELFEECTIEEW